MDFASNRCCVSHAGVGGTKQDRDLETQTPDSGSGEVHELFDLLDLLSRRCNLTSAEDSPVQL